MIHSSKASFRASLTFTLIVAGVLSVLILILGYERTFRLWNVPTRSPYFADLRTITAGADSQRLGYEPMIQNPEDPWNRPMNYPRVWKVAYPLGLTQDHTLWMGIGVLCAFLLGLLLLFRYMSEETLIFALPAVLSPAVLLGVERGNIDLFVFFLAVLSAVYVGSGLWRHALASSLVALFAKLFPIFWFPLYIHARWRRTALPLFIGIGLLYLAITWADLRLIAQATPQTPFTSYGMKGLYLASTQYAPSLARYVLVASFGLILLLFSVACWLYLRGKRFGLVSDDQCRARPEIFQLFLLGSSTYVGTFLVGSNWDYRLVFLLLCLPFSIDILRHAESVIHRGLAKLLLLGIYGSLWGIAFSGLAPYLPKGTIFFLDECLNWLTFCVLTITLAVSWQPCESA